MIFCHLKGLDLIPGCLVLGNSVSSFVEFVHFDRIAAILVCTGERKNHRASLGWQVPVAITNQDGGWIEAYYLDNQTHGKIGGCKQLI